MQSYSSLLSCSHGQLNGESHFHNDLGLDTVEVVMAIEEVCYRAKLVRVKI